MIITAALSGCGSNSGGVGGGAAQQDHGTPFASAVVLTRKWTEVIYGSFSTQPEQKCSPLELPPEIRPDGTVVQEVQYENCVREKRTQLTGRIESVLTFPDGSTAKSTQSSARRSGDIITTEEEQEYPNGDRVLFSRKRDTRGTTRDSEDDVIDYEGRVVFQGRPEATFTLHREHANQVDALTMSLPDGARFAMRIPLRTERGFRTPDIAAATTGRFTSGGRALTFELRGVSASARLWKELRTQGPEDAEGPLPLEGLFTLNPDFSGSGQFTRGGRIDSSISFDRDGKTVVTQIAGVSTTAGPSAAALAFLLHLWRGLFVREAPSLS